MPKTKLESKAVQKVSAESTHAVREVQLATLNILEDFNDEKARLEDSQRAVLNILDDFSIERGQLQGTQKATLNILEDFNIEKGRFEETQRAVLNILDDFEAEKSSLEGTQKATLNILEDFNAEKGRLEGTQRAVLNILDDLNSSNEKLKRAQDVLEVRVTERTAALEQSLKEKEVLLREIHHRVKNNLQIIRSMLNLQLPQVVDPQAIELFKESQNRVYSMALIHEKLYQSESMAKIDFPEYIRSLINYLFISFGVAGGIVKAVINVEDVFLDIDTAIPCALIINELVSNSLKHAFPPERNLGRAKQIEVSMRRDTGRKLRLSVIDNGIGLPEGFSISQSKSLGLKLVTVLVNQIKGSLDVTSSDGSRFVISFAAKDEGETHA